MTEEKKPDDAEFERALSFFLGSCEAQEVDMWDRYDVIKSYAHGYKKLYWDLLASWADLKVEHGVLMERAQPKYKRVDLDALKEKMISDFEEEKESELGRGYELGLCHAVDYLAQNYNITRKTK